MSESVAINTVDISEACCFRFLLFDSPAFDARFNSLRLLVKSILEWIATSVVLVAREVIESMEIQASQKKFTLRISQIQKNGS